MKGGERKRDLMSEENRLFVDKSKLKIAFILSIEYRMKSHIVS